MIIQQFNPLFDPENDYFINNQRENDFYNTFYFEQNLNNNDILPNFQVNNSFSIFSKNKLNDSSNNIEEIKCEIKKIVVQSLILKLIKKYLFLFWKKI